MELASKELQNHLEANDLRHNFGLGNHEDLVEQGKMFGVLVVRNQTAISAGWLPIQGNFTKRLKTILSLPSATYMLLSPFTKKERMS